MKQELHNPFAAQVNTPAPAEERTRWGVVASGPPINPAEVETADAAVEVVLMWGDEDVLHVEHVSPPRDIVIGEGADADYLVGADVLGTPRLPVVVERAGALFCVIADGATGEVEVAGERRGLEGLPGLTEYSELAGAKLYPLPDGATATVRYRGLTFLVRPTQAGQKVSAAGGVSWRRNAWIAASLSVHAAVLMMFYFLPPSAQGLSIDQIGAQDRMVEYMTASAAVVEEETPEFLQESTGESGTEGERHVGDEGQSGSEEAAETGNRYSVRDRNREAALARENARENMEEVGAIGALNRMVGAWNVPTSPFGADTPSGDGALDAIGALMGENAGDSFGYNGLGMRGHGRGAGGTGEGTYGLGRLGTLGTGCTGACNGGHGRGGYGGGVGLRNTRTSRVPQAIAGRAETVGNYSSETIRRVVRRHLSEVRFCYEQGLQANPSIEGRVTVNWIISPTGAVSSARVANSTLSDARVEQCVAGAVRRWSFPAPGGGSPIGVNYPFMLQTR